MARSSNSLVNRPEPLDETRTMQHKLRLAAFNGISEDDVKAIVQKQVEQAKSGDLKATQFVCDYLLGAKMQVQATQINHFHGSDSHVDQGEPPGLAGSPERIEAMRRRASSGRSVFDGAAIDEDDEDFASE